MSELNEKNQEITIDDTSIENQQNDDILELQDDSTQGNEQNDIQEDKIDSSQEEKEQEETSERQQPNTGDYDLDEIYKFLQDGGIISEKGDDVKFNNIGELSDHIYKQQQVNVEKQVQEKLESFPESYKDLFDYVSKGGNPQDFVNNYSTSYTELQPKNLVDDITLQKKVLIDSYKISTNWDNNVIERHLSKFNDDEIKSMSKEALGDLKDYEREQREQVIKQNTEKEIQIKQYYDNLMEGYNTDINKLVNLGINQATMKDKDELKQNLVNNVTYNKLSENFDKYRLNLAILDKLGLLDDPNKINNFNKESNKKYNFKKNTKPTSIKKNSSFDLNLFGKKESDNQDGRIDLII